MYSVVLALALAGTTEATDGHHGWGGYGGYCGCYGGYGGYSGGYGCWGGGYGGYGCWGGGYGGYGCWGGGYGGYSSYCGGYGGYSGNWGGYYGGYGCYGYTPAPPAMTPPPPVDKGGKPGMTSNEPAPATVVVNLPAEARLKINDNPTTSTSSARTFQTPELPTGKYFAYTLTAEITRDGKSVTQTEKIIVRAGQEARVTIAFPPSVAAK